MWKMRSWSIKGVDLGVKMPVKREKPIFRMSAENGQKGVRNGVLGEEKGKTSAEKAFFVQVGQIFHNTDIQCVM
jgi:hypothetical protein